MRNLQTWEHKIRPKLIRQFTPRIQQDLNSIKTPKLPAEVESTYLYGDTEVGKTIYACLLLLQEYKNIYMTGNISDNRLLFVSFPEMFLEIKNTFNTTDNSESQVLDKYKDADLLVLDDFGVKSLSDWALELLYIIINHRYEFNKKTIITSNHSLQELAGILEDDRIPSRIERMCSISKKIKNWK